MWSDAEKEEMRLYAEGITPRNWNVILNAADLTCETGVLNVLLIFADAGDEGSRSREDLTPECRDTDPAYQGGRVSGGMLFTDLKERGVDQEGKMAQAVVLLADHFGDWRESLVHALAQLAVYRWHAFRMKAYRKEGTVMVRPGYDMTPGNDPIFQHALSIMADRARAF
jgi:hypothetical protein